MAGRQLRKFLTSAPWGMLWAIAILILVERAVFHHRLDLASRNTIGITHTHQAIYGESRDSSVLAMGDSLVKAGVSPTVIEKRLGRKTFNLAIHGAIAPMTYYMLEQALSRAPQPSAIIVDFKPSQLTIHPSLVLPGFSSEMNFGQCVDFARTMKSSSFFAQLLTHKYIPSLKERWGIREYVSSALAGKAIDKRSTNLSALIRWSADRGADSLPVVPWIESIETTWDEGTYVPDTPLPFDFLNLVYLKRFLELSERNKIPVFWVAPPLHPRIQAKRDARGLDATFTSLLRSSVERFEGLTVIDARRSFYPVRKFVDGAHLDHEGAAIFSDSVAEVMKERLRGPSDRDRWVNLPTFSQSTESLASESDTPVPLNVHDTPGVSESGSKSGRLTR